MSEHKDKLKTGPSSKAYKDNYSLIDWQIKPKRPKRIVKPHESKRANFATPYISGDYEAYECPVTGKMIEGRVAHRENLKQTGCRLLERGEFEDAKKNGERYRNEKLDAAIDKSVDEIAHTLDI